MRPVTLEVRLERLVEMLVIAGLIYLIGRVLQKLIGDNPKRRRHGKYVFWWMFGGYLCGAALGVCIIDNIRFYEREADGGLAFTGLLLGWVIGMIHGGMALAFWPEKPKEVEFDD